MRIAIVSQYYTPEPVEKVHDFARGLVGLGHTVEVLTGVPCYPYGKLYAGYHQRWLRCDFIDGVAVHRVPQFPDHSDKLWPRALYYLSFAFFAAILGPCCFRRPDIIVVYQAAFPVGFAGWVLSRVFGAPLVLDVVDLWPESLVASGLKVKPYVTAAITLMMRCLYNAAHHINVITEGYRRSLLNLGVPDAKLSVIEHWCPDLPLNEGDASQAFVHRHDLSSRFVVMYAGNMGIAQHLDSVLDAASLLRCDDRIRFVLVGGGTQFRRLVTRVECEGLRNVIFAGRFSPDSMPGVIASADALLVHLKPDLMSEVSIPSKTCTYMACGRPVIMAVRGEAAAFLEHNRFGVTADPVNASSIAAAVLTLRNMSTRQRELLGRNGRVAFEQRYCSKVQVRKFERLLRTVVESYNVDGVKHGRRAARK